MAGRRGMKTIKIGFGYKARHGKDTACQHIVAKRSLQCDVIQVAFADALRAEVNAAVFDRWMQDCPDEPFARRLAMRCLCQWAGVPYDACAPVTADNPYGKQRALLQWWGTKYRRAQDPEYWTKRLAETLERRQPTFAVISDMRFRNEFDFCDYRIRLDRPGFEIASGAHHSSETQLDDLPDDAWDTILTSSTPEQVERAALATFDAIAQHARDRNSGSPKPAACAAV